MILIALGANLPSQYGTPADTIKAAIKTIAEHDAINVLESARIWLTAPVPFDPEQDWYHNSLISVETDLPPQELLKTMLGIEEKFGRIRTIKNAPRVLDLDLIAYNEKIIDGHDDLILPHQRMHERLFVLKPLEDIDKNWLHPKTGQTVQDMIDHCSQVQQAKPTDERESND